VRRSARAAAAIACATAAGLACAPALREPPPLKPPAAPAPGVSADDLLRRADAAWARRAEPGQAEAAQELYLQAASADERRADGLLGAMRAAAYRVEREKDGAARERLAVEEVQLGQWCQRRAPDDPACKYRLAIGLGQQARERTSSAKDALERMVKLLREAAAAAPRLDRAGPHRVLALVLLRAPGWPLGPGDPEQALREAQAAVDLFPGAPDNQLALGEALAKNDRAAEARAAFEKAAALADRDAAADPDAARWRDEARDALAKGGHR
jgi:tetratricopeptide (TPR) repeat protein